MGGFKERPYIFFVSKEEGEKKGYQFGLENALSRAKGSCQCA